MQNSVNEVFRYNVSIFSFLRYLSKNHFKTIRNTICTIVGDRNGTVIIITGHTQAANTEATTVRRIYRAVTILIMTRIFKANGNKVKFLSTPLRFNLFSALSININIFVTPTLCLHDIKISRYKTLVYFPLFYSYI